MSDETHDILARAAPPAAHRLAWGRQPSQFGELFMPSSGGAHPTVIAIHGGFWRSAYDLRHLALLCAALAREGFAVWSLEYRRVGEPGGGWPGTFEDVAAGAAHLGVLAPEHGLDLARTIVLGHSAGGHLALWLGARHRLPLQDPFRSIPLVGLRGVVGLAAITDPVRAAALALSRGAAIELLGGTPEQVPERYALASPGAWLPLGVPQHLVHGEKDRTVSPDFSRQYAAQAAGRGDTVSLDILADAGHYALMNPLSSAWKTVLDAVRGLV